ncbi:MAG: methylglyoxal synthase [Myxococcales bacterium]|nr:methylglyoxal synthase [Myxococcales bacterium]MCB9708952.1 methylglyoxal synthase [Myxococcales bacterium]
MPAENRKTLALIAHDNKKADMVAFALQHFEILRSYDLVATNTTGQVLKENCGLSLRQVLSGPQGGDAQIAALVAEGQIRAVFFFVDPLGKHSHEPDIQSLMRICNVHNIPLATNAATAKHIISERAIGSFADDVGIRER